MDEEITPNNDPNKKENNATSLSSTDANMYVPETGVLVPLDHDIISFLEQISEQSAVDGPIEQEHARAKTTTDEDMALINVISEFLGCFTVIGFDFDGEPVCLSFNKNTQETAALNALVKRYTGLL